MGLHPDPEVCKLSQSESLSSGLGTHQIVPLRERKWGSGRVKQVPLRGNGFVESYPDSFREGERRRFGRARERKK